MGMFKSPKLGLSKTDVTEHNMFGSKKKKIQIGHTFKGSKKDRNKLPISATKRSAAISPSMEEFDNMMQNMTSKSSMSKKKGLFSRTK